MSERLTPEQTDVLTGRELDAAVERMVFGRTFLGQALVQPSYDLQGEEVEPEQEPSEYTAEAWVYLDGCCCDLRQKLELDSAEVLGHLWQCLSVCRRYSEHIADAWLVVEHLRATGWELNLSANCQVHEHWDCRLFVMDRRSGAASRIAIAHGTTAPEAICRAALLAVSS